MEMEIENERTEIIILLETIKENIKNNPDMKCWQGIILVNSKEYHWRVTERDLNADNKEF